ncbi:MAG: MAPEG family protein [Aquabacterium sp.]
MTPDLRYLAFTAMLTGSLWIPYVICQVMTNGFLTPTNYADPQPRPVPLWGKRADRALMNGIEVLGTFAALVIVAHLAGKANTTTAMWAAVFFWARAAHAVVYWLAVPYIRTVLFTVGYVAMLGIFWEIVR